ncbi:filamentous hemagglutinin N-terminal domain-containing protein [Nostoc sp. TCL26-01]|uniref:two-partner secretion domain-containing protein n=1 Tax=Nostoc sp. TCL26-01 TaxID=2576904 RepID=UPI0015BEDDFE|nr:filamentous hemagglutinin N-terminal domain-containing protein [Nostoc sp. TCL26-01]QLE56943.1 filamentous hemagglutinin N-terminal domain-containing protein [Nostoc sp. TCL26-01]
MLKPTFLAGIGILLFWLLNITSTKAEIIPDNTLPNNSTVRPVRNIQVIEGGTQRGENLFHSFQEFSFSVLTTNTTGNTALFNHDLAVRNIITRITGSSPAYIDGTITVRPGSRANLFFISPRGIIFGANASLNIAGSFVATTANSLRFADGTEFRANANNNAPLLTVSVPVGLQFGSNSGDISQPNANVLPLALTVQNGQTLALIGGNVSLQASSLAAPGGRIELGSVTGSGFVNLSVVERGYAFGYSGVENFGNIELANGAIVDTSDFPVVDSSGTIHIQGRNITVSDDSLVFALNFGSKAGDNLILSASESIRLSGSSNIASSAEGEGTAGNVLITAGNSVELRETSFIGSQVCAFNPRCVNVTGRGGNVTVNTSRLLLTGGSGIEASTFGTGKAGDIFVRATDTINLIGETPDGDIPSGIFAQVAVDAIDDAGGTGNLTLETRRLSIQGGAQISIAARYGGSGGDLSINASDSVQLSGASQLATAAPNDIFRSGIFVSAQPGATNNVGNLNINTGLLRVEDGARITTDNYGSGNVGSLRLNVRQLAIWDGGEVRVGAFGIGSGGDLIVNATDAVEVIGIGRNTPSRLSMIGEGRGEIGNLDITARSLKLDSQGQLLTQTTSANGGNITLNLQRILQLRRNSQISTSAGTALLGGNGGNIEINSPFIVSSTDENSDISANAFNGQGGKVTINTKRIFGFVVRSRAELEQLLGTTDITQLNAQRLLSNDIIAITPGNPLINILPSVNPIDIDANSTVVPLPANDVVNLSSLDVASQQKFAFLPVNPIKVDTSIVQICSPDHQPRPSSLFITTNNIPQTLEGASLINQRINLSNRHSDFGNLHNSLIGDKLRFIPVVNIPESSTIVEAQRWIVDTNGKIVLVAQAKTKQSC